MEDYIPLIIVILISIIGAVNRNKKRKEHENISTPHQPIHRDDDFLGWLEKLNIVEDDSPVSEEKSFMGMDQSEVVPAKVVIVEAPAKNEAIPNIFSKYSGFISPEERIDLMSKEGISAVSKKGISDGDLTKQTLKESDEFEEKSKFEIDLRKAVIYNEILNRKYI
jgi:hypothetical protein